MKSQGDRKGAQESQAPRVQRRPRYWELSMVSGRRGSAPLQPASTVQTFLRPASSRQGSRCQASQAGQSRPLSTKSEAVPAEGVACLTLHRPAAPGGDAWPQGRARSGQERVSGRPELRGWSGVLAPLPPTFGNEGRRSRLDCQGKALLKSGILSKRKIGCGIF